MKKGNSMKRRAGPDSKRRLGFSGLARRFWRDARGAFAMQFALLVAPLVICTGLAIDGGRSFLARYELESALDAAALAVGSSTGDNNALNALARKYVDSNFKSPDTTQVVLELNPTNDVVTLRGTTQLSTYFMPLIGVPKVTVSATSEVRRGGGNVEVALMLDITGSMGLRTDPNSRISTLIRAANNMIDTVVNDTQTPWFSKVAIVPWANNVYAGPAFVGGVATTPNYAPALRGSTAGTTITSATWKKDIQTISAITWRNGSALVVTAAGWKNGSAKTASRIREASSVTTVTSNSHGYSNGDFIYITNANGGFNSLNGNIYRVANVATNTFRLQTVAGVDVNLSGTPSDANTATLQKCYTSTCQVMVTTQTAHGLAVGDTLYLSSIMSEINSTATSSSTTAITLAALGPTSPTTTFMVPGTTPAGVTSTYSGTAGRVQKCFTSTCQFQIQTSGSHTFNSGDRVFITGVSFSPSSGAPSINTTAGTSLSLTSTLSNAFLFPSLIGPYYTNTYTASSGTANTCFGSAATCEMQLTAPAHGILSGERAFITGVSGLTGSTTVNNLYTGQSGGPTSWSPTSITTDTFILPGTTGPNMTAYTADSGTVFCLKSGCQYYRYTADSGSRPIRPISNCVTERTGTEAYTGAGPGSGAWLGFDYPIPGDEYNDCITSNPIVPLTSNKTTLHASINNLQVTGSTAGQIGVGWGWYMLSPGFASIWPASENRALAYGSTNLTKVMVLMTDGDFNTAHCGGVASKDYQVDLEDYERANCNSDNGVPYTQASTLCTNMKANAYKIEIYTVGFQVTAGSAADQFLSACATQTGGQHYFLASNNAQLEAAFAKIATNISRLRLSR